MSRLTSRSSSSAPTGCQNTPSAVIVISGTRSARANAMPCVAKPRSAMRRITRSSSLTCWASRKLRNSSASASVETVAANRTRNPSARARSMPFQARAHVPFPRWLSWRSGVGLSRLICNVTRSRGNDAQRFETTSGKQHAVGEDRGRRRRSAGGENLANVRQHEGSPPVTKISLTPSSAASLAIRRTRSMPSARRGALGDERTQQ